MERLADTSRLPVTVADCAETPFRPIGGAFPDAPLHRRHDHGKPICPEPGWNSQLQDRETDKCRPGTHCCERGGRDPSPVLHPRVNSVGAGKRDASGQLHRWCPCRGDRCHDADLRRADGSCIAAPAQPNGFAPCFPTPLFQVELIHSHCHEFAGWHSPGTKKDARRKLDATKSRCGAAPAPQAVPPCAVVRVSSLTSREAAHDRTCSGHWKAFSILLRGIPAIDKVIASGDETRLI